MNPALPTANLRLIEQYKNCDVTRMAKSDAMKTFLPFWTNLSADEQSELVKKIDAFRGSRSGGPFAKSEDIQNQCLDEIKEEIGKCVRLRTVHDVEELNEALHQIIKNQSSLFKFRVTASLNALLFVAKDETVRSTYQKGNNKTFKQTLLNNINAKKPKPALMFALAQRLDQFTTQSEHIQIMQGILDGKFGKDLQILSKVASGIGKMKINVNDEKIADLIFECMDNRVFGNDPDTRLNLAGSINKIFSSYSGYNEMVDVSKDILVRLSGYIPWLIGSNEKRSEQVALELARGHLFIKYSPNAQAAFLGNVVVGCFSGDIVKGKCYSTAEMALELATHIELMQWYDCRNLDIANLLVEYSNELLIPNKTQRRLPHLDREIIRRIAVAISRGVFSQSKEALIKMINVFNLRASHLSEKDVSPLLQAYYDGEFNFVEDTPQFKLLKGMMQPVMTENKWTWDKTPASWTNKPK